MSWFDDNAPSWGTRPGAEVGGVTGRTGGNLMAAPTPAPPASTGNLMDSWTSPWNASLNLPTYSVPTFGGFTAPNKVTMENDPGYQFRLNETANRVKALMSANGTYYTPNTANEIMQRVGDQASSEFQGVFNRAYQGYGANLNAAQANAANALNAYQSQRDKALQEYMLGRETTWGNQDRAYNKTFNLMNFGYQAASNPYAQNYANNAGDLYQGLGNVGAAGDIGRGNLWGSYFQNLSNIVGNNPMSQGNNGNNIATSHGRY